MMEHTYIMVFILLSYIIIIASCSEYVDPKKIFFTFDEHASNDEEQSSSGKDEEQNSSGNPEQKQHCTNTDKYNKCISDRKFICNQYLTFLSVIENLADQHANQQVLTFDLHLSSSDVFAIKNVLRSRNCPDDTLFLMTNIQPHYSWKIKIVDILTDFISRNKTIIGIVSATLICFLLLVYWMYTSRSWFSGILKIIMLAFIASVVETSVRKYQEQLALNKAVLSQGVPKSCQLEDQGYLYFAWIYLSQKFSVMENDCVTYYKAEIIEPMFKFTIIEAVTETLSRWILTPVPIILEYLGNSIVTFFRILPVQLWLPFTILIYITIVLYILLANGYRIRSFLITIEPAPEIRAVTSDNPSNQGNFLTRIAHSLTTSAQNFIVRNQIEDLPRTTGRSPNIDSSNKDEKELIAGVETEPLSGKTETNPTTLSTTLNEQVQRKGVSLSLTGGDESYQGSSSSLSHTKNDIRNDPISEIHPKAIPHQRTEDRKEPHSIGHMATDNCQGEGDGVETFPCFAPKSD